MIIPTTVNANRGEALLGEAVSNESIDDKSKNPSTCKLGGGAIGKYNLISSSVILD